MEGNRLCFLREVIYCFVLWFGHTADVLCVVYFKYEKRQRVAHVFLALAVECTTASHTSNYKVIHQLVSNSKT